MCRLVPLLGVAAWASPAVSATPAAELPGPHPSLGIAEAAEPPGLIARTSVERYARLLALDPDQASTILDLHDGYATAYRVATRERRAAYDALRRDESADQSALAEKRAAVQQGHAARLTALERSFFEDLSTMLTDAQRERMPGVERARRRERFLRGVISGEGVDLVEVIDGLRLPAEASAALAAPLAAYELDLDRALADKQRTIESEDTGAPATVFSAPAIMKRTVRTRVVGLRIRDLNDRYARAVEAALPEESRASFRDAVRSAAFPSVYRATQGTQLLDAAEQLDDLDDAQRAGVDAARRAYERDLAAANDAIVSAIRELESAERSVIVPMPTGETMQVLLGPLDTNPVVNAIKARSQLDARLREKLEAGLRPAQIDRLPEILDHPPDERLLVDDTAVMIVRPR